MPNTKEPDKAAIISEHSAKKPSNGEPEEDSGSSGIIPVEKLHEIIREERIATFLEIDKERKATLGYLTQERRAVVEEFKNEVHRITEMIRSERRETMVDLDATGDKIVENTIFKSKQLIDHFFIRLLQLLAIIILVFSIIGFIIYRIVAKNEKSTFFVGDWALTQLWLFWVAPIVGGILGAAIYRFIGSEKD